MQDHKIRNLIEESPLSPEQKRFLLQFMALKGINIEFFDTFYTYLKEVAEGGVKKYAEAIERMEHLQRELDAKVTQEKAEIEESLERKLSAIDPLDLGSKRAVWEEYYDTLDELGERYDKKLAEIIARVSPKV